MTQKPVRALLVGILLMVVPVGADAAKSNSAEPTLEGARIVEQVNGNLYRWPADDRQIAFTIQASFIDAQLEQFEQGLEKAETGNEDAQRFLDTLRQMKILGTYQLSTGVVETDIALPEELDEPARQDGLMQMRSGVYRMVSGIFMSLSLHREGLLQPGEQVTSTELTGELYGLETTSADGRINQRHLIDRQTFLPRGVGAMGLVQTYENYLPVADKQLVHTYSTRTAEGVMIGRFSVDYEGVDGIQFPSHITIQLKDQPEIEINLLDLHIAKATDQEGN